jgi:hypothetical protein
VGGEVSNARINRRVGELLAKGIPLGQAMAQAVQDTDKTSSTIRRAA